MSPLANMTLLQELALRRLCQGYSVSFDPAHYSPQFDLPPGYVAGWIGGQHRIHESPAGRPTIYVGVSAEGEVSS